MFKREKEISSLHTLPVFYFKSMRRYRTFGFPYVPESSYSIVKSNNW